MLGGLGGCHFELDLGRFGRLGFCGMPSGYVVVWFESKVGGNYVRENGQVHMSWQGTLSAVEACDGGK